MNIDRELLEREREREKDMAMAMVMVLRRLASSIDNGGSLYYMVFFLSLFLLCS